MKVAGASGTSYLWAGAPYPLRWVPRGLYQLELRPMTWTGADVPLLAKSPFFSIDSGNAAQTDGPTDEVSQHRLGSLGACWANTPGFHSPRHQQIPRATTVRSLARRQLLDSVWPSGCLRWWERWLWAGVSGSGSKRRPRKRGDSREASLSLAEGNECKLI